MWIVSNSKVKHPDLPKKATVILLDTEVSAARAESERGPRRAFPHMLMPHEDR